MMGSLSRPQQDVLLEIADLLSDKRLRATIDVLRRERVALDAERARLEAAWAQLRAARTEFERQKRGLREIVEADDEPCELVETGLS